MSDIGFALRSELRAGRERLIAAFNAGGPVDGTTGGGNSTIAARLANTTESPTAHLPANLRFPGSRYCASADCVST